MGGQVRKGEKATHVLFYKFDDEREKPRRARPITPASVARGQGRAGRHAPADGPLLRRL